MPDVVLVDTNILPMWRRLDGPLWLSVRKLCDVLGLKLVIPELVVHESLNLRRQTYNVAVTKFLDSIQQIGRFFDLEPIYVPDVVEIDDEWETELREVFEVLPVDGTDAVSALTREAQRVRPARNGVGARDSAIWMTVLRLAMSHSAVYFVSNNTADFAAGKSGELHSTLVADTNAVQGEVRYVTSIYGLIEALATTIDNPAIDDTLVTELLTDEIREIVLKKIELDERYSAAYPSEISADCVALRDVTAVRTYSTGDRSLTLLKAEGSVIVGFAEHLTTVELSVGAWIDFTGESNEPMSGEIHSIQLKDP